MKLQELITQFSDTRERQIRGIFANLFILQNKLQTVFDNSSQGITLKQFMLLIMVKQGKEPLTFTQLGELLGCSRQNIKKLADALEKKGFVTISANEKDARAAVITPTPAVEQFFVQAAKQHEEILGALFAQYEDVEIKQLYDGLAKLHGGIEQMKGEQK